MSLRTQLVAIIAEVETLETSHATLTAELAAAKARIAELDALVADLRRQLAVIPPPPEPPPPVEPPPPPPVVVGEEYPANPAVILSPGANVQAALAPGKIVELKPGQYGDLRLTPPAGVHIFCRVPHGALFTHPHKGQCKDHPFINAGGAGVTLRGFTVDGYSAFPKQGTTSYEGSGAITIPDDNWKLLDFTMKNIFDTAIRGGGNPGTRIERYIGNGIGRYFAANFSRALFKDGVVRHVNDGIGVPKPGGSTNVGFCKFAADSTEVTVDGLLLEDIDGNGPWWDGRGTNGIARNIKGYRVTGNVVSVEVCDGNFLVENVHAEDSCEPLSSHPDWPVKAVVLCVLTPDMTVKNITGSRVGNGVTATAPNRADGGGLRNLLVDGFEFHSVGRWTAGWAGGTRIEPATLKWRNGKWDTGARFRTGSQTGLTASQWMALPQSE